MSGDRSNPHAELHAEFAAKNEQAAINASELKKNYNRHLVDGIETREQLLGALAEIRRTGTSILPAEVDLIEDANAKEAIKNSFRKVGTDISTIAALMEKMLEKNM